MDHQSRKCEVLERFSTTNVYGQSGGHQVPAMEGENILEEVGSCIWDGGNDSAPSDEATFVVAWSLARMEPSRMPKQLLFGELGKKRPSHGTKRRWRDVATADIKAVGVKMMGGMTWYRTGKHGELCVKTGSHL